MAAAVATWLIGGAWGMFPGMLLGMLIGMIIALVLGLALLTPILGVMEVLTPCMLSACMLSGMFGGMWGGMWPLTVIEVLKWGGGTGVAVVVIIYVLNTIVTGPQRIGI